MNKLKHIFLSLFSFSLMLLISGCKMVVLDPKGTVAADEKDLLIIALLLMLIIVIPVIVLTFVFAVKYRASNTKAKYSPEFTHSGKLEAIWWGIPIIIIAILATITWITTHTLDPYRPLNVEGNPKPLTIQVVSLQWRWLFIYPEQKIATINYIEFPVNRPVEFDLTSDAPMNSFQIPQLGGQIYTMAGMTTKLHLIANAEGVYNGRSVSYSGDGFSGMEFVAKATNPQTFNEWVNTVKKSANKLTMNSYTQLAAPSEDGSVQYFSSVEDNLFNDVVMKYMQPAASNDASTMSMPSAQNNDGVNYKSRRNYSYAK